MYYPIEIRKTGSRLAIVLIGFVLLLFFFRDKAWTNNHAIRHDMTSYYAYLPSAFKYHDLTLSYDDGTFGDKLAWSFPSKNGRILRMTMGVSIMETPFYLLADLWASVFGLEKDPWSAHYLFFIFLGVLVYAIAGLALVYRIIASLFSSKTAFWTCLALGIGTNLYYYLYYEPVMSHIFNFFLVALLLYLTLKWHKKQSWKLALGIGLALGMLTLIRPTNALMVLLPLLYAANRKEKWQAVVTNWWQLFLVTLGLFICLFPQMAYWKYLSGDWIVYSYEKERFFFDAPMVWKGLFGFRKGWMIYTPLMLTILPGFVLLWKKYPELFWPLVVVFAAHVYVTFSWWCWWYGGGFGSRPMIDTYALAAIPLAALVYTCFHKLGKGSRTGMLLFLGVCIFLNLEQTRQYRMSLIHWDSMSWPLYKAVFMNDRFPENYEELLDPPDYQKALEGERDI